MGASWGIFAVAFPRKSKFLNLASDFFEKALAFCFGLCYNIRCFDAHITHDDAKATQTRLENKPTSSHFISPTPCSTWLLRN